MIISDTLTLLSHVLLAFLFNMIDTDTVVCQFTLYAHHPRSFLNYNHTIMPSAKSKFHLLTPVQLSNLKLYKYSGVDRSFLSRYILNPFWCWLVTFFPLWMA